MLRHLRMAPATTELPRTEGRLLGMVQEWCRPLYRYRIPHTPAPRDRVCTCAYPLYTLRPSRRSPYDEPTEHATAALEAIDATGLGSSAPSLALSAGGAAATTAGPSPTPPAHTTAAPFLSSFSALPSLRARWAVRRRSSRQAAVAAACSALSSATAAPPPAETCYRCDICDGLQGHDDSSGAHESRTAAAPCDATRSAAEWNEEDERDAAAGAAAATSLSLPDSSTAEERYGLATSTDIANTAMEDADVAELRHLDPFHVEVFGRPSWTGLTKTIAREVQAQLTRCGLRKRDLSLYAAQASLNSEVGSQTYKMWVRRESRRLRERQLQTASAAALAAGASGPASELTVAPADPAIVKAKLDTLDTAAYLARYATAAYGLPFELNYFSSLRELTKLMAEPHRRYVCAKSEEQLESMRRMLQGEAPDALLECVASRYSLRVGQSCWSLFLDHAANRVVLAFRGSLTPADITVDVTEGYAHVVLESGVADASPAAAQRLCTAVPLGFYESVVEAGAQVLPLLRAIHAQYSAYELCITGHSLGGVQASLFHLFYCAPWRATLQSTTTALRRTKVLACPSPLPSPDAVDGAASPLQFARTVTCTFGAAPVVERCVVAQLNAWLQQEERRSGSRLIAFSNGMDLVCRLQVRSLRDAFVRQYPRPVEEGLAGPDAAAASDADGEAATPADKWVPRLAIPGALYNMSVGTRRRHLLAVPLTAAAVREQVVLVPEAALHHFPSLYLRSLNDLLRRYQATWQSITAASAPAGSTPTTPVTAVAEPAPAQASAATPVLGTGSHHLPELRAPVEAVAAHT
ncbi:Lipase (class 3) [Novymonas esmeraldas]|uniref:sn-1-specific diacylglycerol lipase n=1 Tax=Novymonas esmeraldas TaxID=1808958 RepID=A0AAW0ENM9_9TRYP